VTIALGFVCSDGIVMCADRQITVPGHFKFDECKIFKASNADYGLLFCYSGNPDSAQVMFNKVVQDFSRGLAKADASLNRIAKIVAALEPIFHNKNAKGLQTLIGFRFPDSMCCMAKTDGEQVVMVVADYIGGGDSSVLRFFDDLLLQENMTIHEAEVIGSYVVSVANRYIDGCSGGPDFAIIHTAGMVGEGGFVFPNQKERFAHCEAEIAKELRALLLSGGHKGRDKK
jgi:20S proteasome alpha/beta subunit